MMSRLTPSRRTRRPLRTSLPTRRATPPVRDGRAPSPHGRAPSAHPTQPTRRSAGGLRHTIEHHGLVADRPGSGVEPAAAGAARVESEGGKEGVGRGRRRGTDLEQSVGSHARPLIDRTRNREDVDPPLGGLSRRDQAAASFTTLDHDHDLGQRSEDPVALRESKGIGRRARRPLGQDHPDLGDLFPQRSVPARIRVAVPVRHDRCRERPMRQRALRGVRHHRRRAPGRTRRTRRPPRVRHRIAPRSARRDAWGCGCRRCRLADLRARRRRPGRRAPPVAADRRATGPATRDRPARRSEHRATRSARPPRSGVDRRGRRLPSARTARGSAGTPRRSTATAAQSPDAIAYASTSDRPEHSATRRERGHVIEPGQCGQVCTFGSGDHAAALEVPIGRDVGAQLERERDRRLVDHRRRLDAEVGDRARHPPDAVIATPARVGPAPSDRATPSSASGDNGASASRSPAESPALTTPCRSIARARAIATRCATMALDSPRSPLSRSSTIGRSTRTRRSNRSSNGPDTRPEYLATWASPHSQPARPAAFAARTRDSSPPRAGSATESWCAGARARPAPRHPRAAVESCPSPSG